MAEVSYGTMSEDSRLQIKFVDIGGSENSRNLASEYYIKPDAVLVVLKAGPEFKMYLSPISRLKMYLKQIYSSIDKSVCEVPVNIVLRYQDYKIEHLDEISDFCYERNICIHQERKIDKKSSTFIINHIMKRVLKEDISSLDVDNIDPEKVEIYKKIRKSPFIKRFMITKSNQMGRVFEKMK